MTLRITSKAFDAGRAIPRKHAGEGSDTSPPLAWAGVPDGTEELALLCEDPDAPRPTPWVHWLVAGIPATRTGFEEGVSDPALVEGTNDFGKRGHGGPMPPPGHGVHHYHFKLYALDAPTKLAAGFTKAQLLAAVKGHVLAEAEIVGTYERR